MSNKDQIIFDGAEPVINDVVDSLSPINKIYLRLSNIEQKLGIINQWSSLDEDLHTEIKKLRNQSVGNNE